LWDAGGGLLATLSSTLDTAAKHYSAKAKHEQMKQQSRFVESVNRVVQIV